MGERKNAVGGGDKKIGEPIGSPRNCFRLEMESDLVDDLVSQSVFECLGSVEIEISIGVLSDPL